MPATFVLPGLAASAEGALCPLPPEEAVHATRVLRLKPGVAVRLIDGAGWTAEAAVVEAGRGAVWVRVGKRSRPEPPRPAVHVLAAPPKGSRVEAMVDALAQLGCASWTPLLTERGEPDGSPNRRRRWERAAAEAAKQCGRADFMQVAAALPLAEALERPPAGVRVLADPTGERPELAAETEVVEIFVGPEGGFSDAERDAVLAAGATPWSLGPYILRIETAALAAATRAGASATGGLSRRPA